MSTLNYMTNGEVRWCLTFKKAVGTKGVSQVTY